MSFLRASIRTERRSVSPGIMGISRDLKGAFCDTLSDRRCTPDDYMTWIPSDTGVGERCLLGQKTEFQTRNWTVKCLVGKDYVRKVNTSSCLCRRTDFQW